MTFADDFAPITPVNFFQISTDCNYLEGLQSATFPLLNARNYRKYLLPDTSALCSEASFAQIAMGWNEEGLEFYAAINKPFQRAQYPEVERGDSVEIFIDTRDVKTSGFNTRFCHHFFFLAEAFEGHQAGEITHFRTEDTHPLCDSNDLRVKSQCKATSYTLNIFIPNQCLYGYDPGQFGRIGFTYRVNQFQGFSQHFSVVTDDYQIDQQPSLWGTIRLIK